MGNGRTQLSARAVGLDTCAAEMVLREVPAGQMVFGPHMPAAALHVVVEGMVRLYRLSTTGHEITVAWCGPDDVFGSAVGDGLARASYAEAAEPTRLCVAQAETLRRIAATHPEVALRLLTSLAERVSLAEAKLEQLAFASAEQRVAAALMGRCGGQQRRLRVAHAELAKEAGVARETVTKALKVLESRGAVRTGYRTVEVVAPQALADV